MITGTELKGRWADLCTVTQKLSQGTVELHLRAPASPHPALSRSLRAEDADSACHHPEPHNGLTYPSAGSGYGYDPSESYSSDRPGNNSTTS